MYRELKSNKSITGLPLYENKSFGKRSDFISKPAHDSVRCANITLAID